MTAPGLLSAAEWLWLRSHETPREKWPVHTRIPNPREQRRRQIVGTRWPKVDQVLFAKLVASGYSNKRLEDELGLHRSTVAQYAAEVRRRLAAQGGKP